MNVLINYVMPPGNKTVNLTPEQEAYLASEPEHVRRVILAVRQGMQELGIPEHPNGQHPTPDCDCERWTDALFARVEELLAA